VAEVQPSTGLRFAQLSASALDKEVILGAKFPGNFTATGAVRVVLLHVELTRLIGVSVTNTCHAQTAASIRPLSDACQRHPGFYKHVLLGLIPPRFPGGWHLCYDFFKRTRGQGKWAELSVVGTQQALA
jgi:hypothetical protein